MKEHTKRIGVAPEMLGQRPALPHNQYSFDQEALSFGDVSVRFSTTGTKKHGLRTSTSDGEIGRRLRRFGLATAKFQLPKPSTLAKRWGVSRQAVDGACKAVAIQAHKSAYGDDPTLGTMSVAPLARLINEPNPSPALFVEALSLSGTDAFDKLVSAISDESLRNLLVDYSNDVVSWRFRHGIMDFVGINSDEPWRRRHSQKRYRWLAEALESNAQRVNSYLEATKQEAKYAKETANAKRGVRPRLESGEDGWYPLYVSKPELAIPHTGKLGRRTVYTNEGKYPRNIGRLVTDPERRIFTRKTRSLGAVVVMDCSGSMALSDDDLELLMKSSAGATVLCYSTGNEASPDEPNAWIVARKGRKVRRLPEFPGGNGCDGPALRYGAMLRSNSSQPVIWVSDGHVTGLEDRHRDELRKECNQIVKHYGMHHVRTVGSAVALMKKLQGGSK